MTVGGQVRVYLSRRRKPTICLVCVQKTSRSVLPERPGHLSESSPESPRVIESTARVLPWLTSSWLLHDRGGGICFALRVAPSPRFFMRPSRVRPVGAGPMRFGERSVKVAPAALQAHLSWIISIRSSHLGRLSLSAGLGPSLRCSCRSEPLELTDAVLQQTVQGWQESAHHQSLPVSDSGVSESDCGWNGRQGQPETCPCVGESRIVDCW